eukprot:CAMPEP_0170565266 /NCGR_PEP_ID=MMETSP0211-20121228/77754_1 /TAXON_ID=311385 /ORGANISM="Pseudokeronopsis sp., Strain OXSARD2" /LENGTH=53 /DNA_ID=CAMNT_0010885833 /DNA_START=11 /DNA_END=172 /DNA_ORIENTATION=-
MISGNVKKANGKPLTIDDLVRNPDLLIKQLIKKIGEETDEKQMSCFFEDIISF